MVAGRARIGWGDKGRLIAVLVAIISLGFGGSSILAFVSARSSIASSIENETLPAAADSVYSQIHTDLVKPVFVSSMMANDSFLQDWSVRGEVDLDAIKGYLGQISARYNTITAFFVSARTNNYYYPGGILKTVSKTEPRDLWFYRVSAMNLPYELNVDPDLAHGDALTIFVNYRVIDAKGRYIGAAGVGLSVNTLRDIVASFRDKFGTTIYFVRDTGEIVAGSPLGAPAQLGKVGNDPVLASTAERAMAAKGGSYRYVRGGETLFLRVQSLPELSWFAFVERPEGEAGARARLALIINLSLSVLVLLAVLLASSMTVNRYQSRLERMASHDPLTGALNRLALANIADHEVLTARRSGKPLSVLTLDLDNFKSINDRFGHPAGDAVLVGVAQAAQTALRRADAFCRWGGEEFLALLPECGVDSAASLADKLRVSIAELTLRECAAPVAASVGVAELGPEEGFESLVERADRSLLAAKRAGKDRVVVNRVAKG